MCITPSDRDEGVQPRGGVVRSGECGYRRGGGYGGCDCGGAGGGVSGDCGGEDEAVKEAIMVPGRGRWFRKLVVGTLEGSGRRPCWWWVIH